MGASFKSSGGRELVDALVKLGDKVRKKITRRAVVVGAQIIKKRARGIARAKGVEDTGAVIRNIAGKVEKRTSPDYVQINIGVRHGKPKKNAKRQDDPWYWWQHEFGNSKMAARPFMRPAFEESQEQVIQAITDEVSRGIKV